MATFFGEVILPSSRAFFDDFDDSDLDEQETSKSKAKLTLKKCNEEVAPEYESIIISDGPVACSYTALYMLKNSDKLLAEAEIVIDDESDSAEILIYKPKKVESSKLFLLSNNCLFLQVSQSIDIRIANQLTSLMKPWLTKCKTVYVLASRHSAHFRCEDINMFPSVFVRGLSTSKFTFPLQMKHLDQPNFLSDFPASVLSWCEANEKPGLLMVLYSDQTTLDSVTVRGFTMGLSDVGLSSFIVNEKPDISSCAPLKNMDKTFMYM